MPPCPRALPAHAHAHPMPSLAVETRSILRAHGLHPKKALGQNFLIDREALQSVVRAAEVRPGDVVLEINRQQVSSASDYRKLARSLKKGDTALLRIKHGQSTTYVPVRVK